jgi:hypothetical protein
MGRLYPFGSAPKHLIPDKVCSGSLPTILLTTLAPGITAAPFWSIAFRIRVLTYTGSEAGAAFSRRRKLNVANTKIKVVVFLYARCD